MTDADNPAQHHEQWMQIALEMADKAAASGEVPVGAVLVGPEGEIGRGCNGPIGAHDPTAHAEIVALREAGQRLNNYRMPDTTLYVTVEPCAMCAGALLHARVGLLVFGTREPKGGAVVSRTDSREGTTVLEGHNHRIEVLEGILEAECRVRLKEFFANKRRTGSALPWN